MEKVDLEVQENNMKTFNSIEEVFDYLTQITKDCQEEYNKSQTTTKKPEYEAPSVTTVEQPTSHIETVDDNCYFVPFKVGKHIIDDGVELQFSYKNSNGIWTPGITDRQLVQVLIERNINNAEKVALLQQLLK